MTQLVSLNRSHSFPWPGDHLVTDRALDGTYPYTEEWPAYVADGSERPDEYADDTPSSRMRHLLGEYEDESYFEIRDVYEMYQCFRPPSRGISSLREVHVALHALEWTWESGGYVESGVWLGPTPIEGVTLSPTSDPTGSSPTWTEVYPSEE